MIFTPIGFLKVGGVVLILVGLLGFIGVIGPGTDSLFGSSWYFDNAENWAHLILGVVALLAARVLGMPGRRGLVMLLGLVGILVAVYNIFSTSLGSANLEKPADLLLHLVIGIWALMAARRPRPGIMT